MTTEARPKLPASVKFGIDSILSRPDKKMPDIPDDVEIMRESPCEFAVILVFFYLKNNIV